MTLSPFTGSISSAGKGNIHIRLLPPGTPSFQALNFTYPLKLVCSTPHKLDSEKPAVHSQEDAETGARVHQPTNVPLVFMLSYGGGLLPPDSIELAITLDTGTRLALTTQGSTKIFPSSSSTIRPVVVSSTDQGASPAMARQTLTARIGEGAALLLAPDPVQPFARSHYTQTQSFTIAQTGSLCLLDWVVEGRRARGESWQAGSWRGRNDIWREFASEVGSDSPMQSILMLRDAIILDDGPNGAGQSSLKREGMGVFGTIILAGPLVYKLGQFFMTEFEALPRIGGRKWGDEANELDHADKRTQSLHAWRAKRIEQEVKDKLLWTVANVRSSVVVKFTASELEGAKRWIESFWRWDGTIAAEFGEGGHMCLR